MLKSAKFTSLNFPFTLFVTVTWHFSCICVPSSFVIVAVIVAVPSSPPANGPCILINSGIPFGAKTPVELTVTIFVLFELHVTCVDFPAFAGCILAIKFALSFEL